MTIEKILKNKAALLYVIEKNGSLGYFQLFKILYFANRSHLANYGRCIINDTFCALPKGPVPSMLYDAVKIAKGKEIMYSHNNIEFISSAIKIQGYNLSAKELPDMSMLSKSDIKELDKAIEENRNKDVPTLSEQSHDKAWEAAKSNSSMDILLIAEAGGATTDMIEYIKEHLELDSIIS